MAKYLLSSIFAVFYLGQLSAQIELSRQVVGTLGGSIQLSGQMNISWVGGEVVNQTKSGESSTLTQGFLQPGALIPLSFQLEIVPTSCLTANDGSAQVVGLFGCSMPYTIEWSNGESGTIVYDLTPGLYSVTVSTANCVLTQEFEVVRGNDEACEIVFLNAFSPNEDGMNDKWVIKNIENEKFRENRVEIFNRWGQMVWSADYYNNSDVVWDGVTKDGIKLSSGTYFYLVTINEKTYKGYIEITQ